MGSREIYDYKLQKWVPYVSTLEDVKRRFEEFEQRNKGYPEMTMKVSQLETKLNEKEEKIRHLEEQLNLKVPIVKQVTPIAQAIEIAQSEIQRKKEDMKQPCKKGQQRKKVFSLPKRVRQLNYHGTA